MKSTNSILVAAFLAALSITNTPTNAWAGQTPITGNILGCFYRTTWQSGNPVVPTYFQTVFVFRSEGLVTEPFGEPRVQGKMVAVAISRQAGTSGLTRYGLTYGEGTTQLPDWPYENWTYPSPVGTYFTARGNFLGFFLSSNLAGAEPIGFLKQDFNDGILSEATNLNCTSDETVLMNWFQMAKLDAHNTGVPANFIDW